MPTWVVTGATRGIGYEFVRTLGQDPANSVIALVLGKPEVEKNLADHGIKGVHVIEADVTDRQALLVDGPVCLRRLETLGLVETLRMCSEEVVW